jgi:hypothetical protein
MSQWRNAPPDGHYPPEYGDFGNQTWSYDAQAGSTPPSTAYESSPPPQFLSHTVGQPSYETYQSTSPGDFLSFSGDGLSPYGRSVYGDVDSGFVSDASVPHTPQNQFQPPHSPRFQLQSHHPQYAQPTGISPRVPSNASAAMYRTPSQLSYYAPGPGLSMQTARSQYSNPDTQSLGPYHSQPYQQRQQPQGAPQSWGAPTSGFPRGALNTMDNADWSQQAAQQMQQYSSYPLSPMSSMSHMPPNSQERYSGAHQSVPSIPHDGSSYGYGPTPATTQYSASIPPKYKAPPKVPALHDGKYRKEVLVDGRIETRIKLENRELAIPALDRICRNLAILVNPDTGGPMFPKENIQEAQAVVLKLIRGIEGRPPVKHQPTKTWDGWAKKIRDILSTWDEIAKEPGHDGLKRLRDSQTHINDSVSVSLRVAFASYDQTRLS